MKTIKFLCILFISCLTFNSCSDSDNPDPVNEEEIITTIRLTFTGPSSTVIFQSQDLDGDGPNDPVITVTGTLLANTTYNGSIQFLNELESPSEDITLEVEEEDVEHQILYSLNGSANSSITIDDSDGNGNDLGLATTFSSGSASTGNSITVTLVHEPTKPNDGTVSGAGGEIDATATFTYDVN